MKKVLFITHEVSRTGAPFVLLHFLKWVQYHKNEIQVSVLALRSGILEGDFESVAYEYYELPKLEGEVSLYDLIKKRILKTSNASLPGKTEKMIHKLGSKKFDLIYANSILSIPIASTIKRISGKTKIIAHLHELGTVIKLTVPDFNEYSGDIDHFIVASELVKQNLINTLKINKEKITKIYEFTPLLSLEEKHKEHSVFTVGGSGTTDWRKGYDVFIQVAVFLKKCRPDLIIRYLWVGKMTDFQQIIISQDLIKAGLSNNMEFLGEKESPKEIFQMMDIFLMPSREDPFPLVAIELGMLGKPIICFEGATGITEILAKGGGEIISYLDIKGMAEAVIKYYDNPDKIFEDGKRANQLFSSFTPENMAPKIFETIEKLLSKD